MPSPLVKSVGGLERILYIMGVMGHHYEIITGWLVLKAFFGFMDRDRLEKDMAARYNGLLIGNAISLMIGIALGVTVNIIIRWRLGVHLYWGL